MKKIHIGGSSTIRTCKNTSYVESSKGLRWSPRLRRIATPIEKYWVRNREKTEDMRPYSNFTRISRKAESLLPFGSLGYDFENLCRCSTHIFCSFIWGNSSCNFVVRDHNMVIVLSYEIESVYRFKESFLEAELVQISIHLNIQELLFFFHTFVYFWTLDRYCQLIYDFRNFKKL